MARHKRSRKESLDYHEGLTINQVKIILTELKLDIGKFNEWMFGQTCPILIRHDEKNNHITKSGIYEYDLFRWISSQKTGIAPIWD